MAPNNQVIVEQVLVFGSKYRPKGVIYEVELLVLQQRKAIKQLTVTKTTAGYWVAVLPTERVEFRTRAGKRSQKVVPIRQPAEEGFLVLHVMRGSQVRYFKSLDTLLNSLEKFGDLPFVHVRNGAVV
ncbi:hypothetical protein J3A72_000436 [Stenotrophomonas sp. PvP093]|jgi:hypothetical protein|uniref:hypothetical protein n=1 Tax=unclassified Stenotrophomonas TaxID=196198 RepID=UPI001AE9719A|nr:hypothetical protein [Stenotrophomonas sp. PvP093]MBP2480144.1 hypothetical protein [Stenotrophomonas sp. PvP093]